MDESLAHSPPAFFGNVSEQQFGRGWVIGPFVPGDDDIRASRDAEVKWSSHKAGDKRESWTEHEARTTASFHISGRFAVHLSSGQFILERPGDYLVWGPGINHWWEAIDDSVILTVRWNLSGS
jgi:hypothetical protein